MTRAWQSLHDELLRWRDTGRLADFWWRDDDATARTVALERLLDLSRRTAVPLALAVIPQDVDAGLLQSDDHHVTLLQHGVAHHNRAAPGAKKTEFPVGETTQDALTRLSTARNRLAGLFGARALPVLVPPWNRVSASGLVPALPGAGLHGLSRFGPRDAAHACAGLVQVNTHVDVIDWRGTRGFAGTEVVLAQALAHLRARRLDQVDPLEPTGWLTHHAVHDPATWTFLDELLDRTAGQGLAAWHDAATLFPVR